MRAAATGIKDVAKRAGVSVGTVSNVLNRPDSVSDATRRKVQRAIVELGFIRNEAGRHLRAGSSRTIAYLMLDASNPFFTDVAKGVEEVARQNGVAVYLCNSDSDASRESDYLGLLAEQRVRGILVTPVDDDMTQLEREGYIVQPHTSAGRRPHQGTVFVDHSRRRNAAVTHLIEQGHLRIAFIGGAPGDQQVAVTARGADRTESAGRSPDDLAVLPTDALNFAEGLRGRATLACRSAPSNRGVLFERSRRFGLLQQMTRMGVDVPGDLAIVGYDDRVAGAAAVPLSSVRQPRLTVGRTAAELLLAERGPDDHVHQQVVFHPEPWSEPRRCPHSGMAQPHRRPTASKVLFAPSTPSSRPFFERLTHFARG